MNDELDREFWRAIALTVLVNSASRSLVQTIWDSTVSDDETLRRLRAWNAGCASHIDQVANELYRTQAWRH